MANGGRARGRTQTWPPGTAAGRWRAAAGPLGLSGLLRPASDSLVRWILAELAAGRLVPWLAVAFGSGIVAYFAAEREPALWGAPVLAAGLVSAAVLVRNRPVAFPLLIGIAAAVAGFAVATGRTALLAHPVLRYPAFDARIGGFVETREERERSDRVVVRVHRVEAARIDPKPERVRVSIRKGTAPPVGTFVELRARLSPPLQPLRPGGYDFARALYFQRIGASGFALGTIRIAEAPTAPGFWLHAASVVQGLRDAIDARIRAVVPGDAGSIASALITGKRDAISAPVNDAMYVSSLAHVLSISGYHMAVVAGVVFAVVRGLLALSPGLAGRRPIKKYAAGVALAAATFYLLLSGAEVATQRSFIMISIVLVGVMFDRQVLTLRTLTIAAFAVLAIAPEAVVHPSFQMSFAATLALIASYERGLPWMAASRDTPAGARVALWGGRQVIGLLLASLVAGLATTPYAAYHFHRYAPYGVVANLLAMPIVSIWVMPAGLVALVAAPFGFDGFFWRLMGGGIDWMITVAVWVANWPGAVGRIAAFGTGPLLLGTAGLLLVCLLRTPLRWSGAGLLIGATVWALLTPQPDILVAGDGQTYAIRTADGRLAVLRTGRDSFAAGDWLAADADARTGKEPALAAAFRCDEVGCIGRFADGSLAAVALTSEAFWEDCDRAAIVLSPREAPPRCAAQAIDRRIWRRHGAIALRRAGRTFEITVARPAGYDRPWLPAVAGAPAPASAPPAQQDADPPGPELEAGD